MEDSTMVCDTAWDEAPGRVVFKDRHGWPVYVPQRMCGKPRCFVPCDPDNFGHPSFMEVWCEHCDIELDPEWEWCPRCGARVREEMLS